jgi:chloramphenicol-sensitive protein RarD
MKKGVISGFSSYFIWGLFPIYFKLLHSVPALQVMTHRVVWSFLFLLIIVLIRGEGKAFRLSITPRLFLIYLGAGTLLAINWVTYVWAVGQGYVVEASLGYFINPLVSVLLGVVFLKEKLRPIQWIPVVLAVIGVGYLTISYGKLPWISLVLAFSFGFYGLVKKISPLGSLHGLTLETGAIFVPALVYLLAQEFLGAGAFGHISPFITILLALTGIVTAVPLIMFSYGARNIPLNVLGLLQFITPILQFLSGVFLYGEPFTQHQLIGFGFIWAALLIFSVESFTNHNRGKQILPTNTIAELDEPPL